MVTTATDSSTEGGHNASIDDGSTSFRATTALTKQESYDAENNASNASNASIADAAGTLTISEGIVIAVHDSDGSTSLAIPDVTLNLIDSSSNSTSFTSSDGDITLTSDLTISHVTVTDSSL